MKFSDMAIKKLNSLIARGFTILSIELTPTLTVFVKKDTEVGSIDEFGRVIWH